MSREGFTPGHRRLPIGFADLLLITILVLGGSRLLVPFLLGALSGPREVILGPGAGEAAGPSFQVILLLLATQTAMLLASIWVVAVRWRGTTWRDLGFRPLPRGWGLYAVLLAFLAFPLVGLINTVVQALFLDAPMENPQLELLSPPRVTIWAFLGTVLVTGLLAPLAEEIAFRGLFYRWLRERMGLVLAMVVSSVAFALLHGLPALIPAIAALGALLAWVYERTGSIWASIILHATYNTVVTATLYLALAGGFDLGAPAP